MCQLVSKLTLSDKLNQLRIAGRYQGYKNVSKLGSAHSAGTS